MSNGESALSSILCNLLERGLVPRADHGPNGQGRGGAVPQVPTNPFPTYPVLNMAGVEVAGSIFSIRCNTRTN
jgi:hypothetical protein